MVSQATTEAFLDDCLAKYGAAVERPAIATTITQSPDFVTTTLEWPGSDGSTRLETIRSKYVVGCDGAHSLVRHSAENITFEGAEYPQDFLLCDAHLRDSTFPPDRFSLCLGLSMVGVLPLGDGIHRFILTGRNLAGADGSEPTLEQFQSAITQLGPPGAGTIHDPVWITRFNLHHRGVNAYRDRRLFVAGDAAHIHSPAGGQGMNTGMQDAVNLGWKLAAVLKGGMPTRFNAEELLDSYNKERLPVGQQLLQGTDRLFSFMAGISPILLRLRNLILPWVAPWVVASQARRRWMFDFVSELGIGYRESPIVGTGTQLKKLSSSTSIQGGDRLPDGELVTYRRLDGQDASAHGQQEETRLHRLCVGPRHHILVFWGPDSPDRLDMTTVAELEKINSLITNQGAINRLVGIHHILQVSDLTTGAGDINPLPSLAYLDLQGSRHAQFGFMGKSGHVLVRPDGYIAYIGLLVDAHELVDLLRGG